jgi:hypothetical protein
MSTYSVLPDTLDIVFVQGDELSVLLDFDIDLSGYQFETKIIRVLGVANGNVTDYEDVMSFTKTFIDLSQGTLNLSLTEVQTDSLSLVENYRWYLRWIAPGLITRTVLSGAIVVRSP